MLMPRFFVLLLLLVVATAAAESWVAPDRWLPIARADALALAESQGKAWRDTRQRRAVLLGLGEKGRARLEQRRTARDPKSAELAGLVVAAADRILQQSVPTYGGVSGETAFVAGSEEWMREPADGLVLLLMAQAIAPQPAYQQRIHDLVLAFCRFPSWGRTFLNGDLAAGHMGRAIAMAWDWDRSFWSDAEQHEIIGVIRERMGQLTANIYGGKAWWAGAYAANHNHISVAGAGLCGLAFIDDIPEATEWLAAAWLDLRAAVQHLSPDGSSPEGLAYWTYGTTFILDFLEGVRGVLPVDELYQQPFLRAAGRYRAESSTPGFAAIIPWGDSGPKDFSGPHHLLFRLASEYRDEAVQTVGTRLPFAPRGRLDGLALSWLWFDPTVPSARLPEALDRHFEDIDVLVSRSGWTKSDYLFTLKSGFTNRDHSHLDGGAIALVFGNDWLLPAPGYGEGRVNPDFWDKHGGRWAYFSNTTEANSTLLIAGANQRCDFAARARIDAFATVGDALWARCDLTELYPAASIVRRAVFHRRGEYLVIHDDVGLRSAAAVDWLLQVPPAAETQGDAVRIAGRVGRLAVQGLGGAVRWSERTPTSPRIDLSEKRGRTLTWQQAGTSLRFDVVVLPRANDRQDEAWSATLDPDGSVRLRRSDRTETIHFATQAEAFTTPTLQGVSCFRALTWQQDELKKVTLGAAHKVEFAAGSFTSKDAVTIELTQLGAEVWQVELGPVNVLAYVLRPGWTLVRVGDDTPKVLPVSGELSAASGRYRLSRSAPTTAAK